MRAVPSDEGKRMIFASFGALKLMNEQSKVHFAFRASISCSKIRNNFWIIGRYSPTIILSIILIYDSYVTVGNL